MASMHELAKLVVSPTQASLRLLMSYMGVTLEQLGSREDVISAVNAYIGLRLHILENDLIQHGRNYNSTLSFINELEENVETLLMQSNRYYLDFEKILGYKAEYELFGAQNNVSKIQKVFIMQLSWAKDKYKQEIEKFVIVTGAAMEKDIRYIMTNHGTQVGGGCIGCLLPMIAALLICIALI